MNELIFHHIGVACQNIEEEMLTYRKLGYSQQGNLFEDEMQRIRGVFMDNSGTQVELLEPLRNDGSPIHSFLDKGIHMYHQGFICPNVVDTALSFVDDGCIIVSPAKPAVAFNGRKVCFLMLPNRMLIELIGME